MKKRICRRVEEILATEGPGGLGGNEAAQQHVAECESCFERLEAQAALDHALADLPSRDVSDEVVEGVLAQTRVEPAPELEPSLWRRIALRLRRLPSAKVGLPEWARRGRARASERRTRLRGVGRWALLGAAAASLIVLTSVVLTGLAQRGQKADALARGNRVSHLRVAANQSMAHDTAERDEKNEEAPAAALRMIGAPEEEVMVVDAVGALAAATPPLAETEVKVKKLSELPDESYLLEQAFSSRSKRALGDKVHRREASKPSSRIAGQESRLDFDGRLADREVGDLAVSGTSTESGALGALGQIPAAPPAVQVDDDELQAARGFLDQQGQLDGLAFQEAAGYWSNAYVPGDPAFRLLQARLLGGSGSVLAAVAPTPLRLHEAARRARQPFDPPSQAALAVYLHSEERTLDQERRMLMQVGLQATHRRSGLRPAMNVALVLDLRDAVGPESAAAMRALVMALGEARDLGDRFQLLVAGCPGGALVEPVDFRHGSLILAMNQLFSLGGTTARCLDLPTALETAVERLSLDDDPHRPLGSSVVLLVTTQPLGTEMERLARLAHGSAVSGIPWSVVGIGDDVQREELDHLALAGQGNRRLLRSASEATGLIDRELSAASRVVARALRLRIRLAPGVELVEILGSERLDELRAEGVRESERSIDLRLARNLGIEADRGEDEEGVQIVIPSFYAGDSHVVLLDVVVPGPGPVADVTVRYKDLVYLRNGVTRDNLSLQRGTSGPGPLEVNVTKNLLAFRLFEVLEGAGDAVARGDLSTALERLSSFRGLLAGLRGEVPGLEHDPDIAADLAMLEEYLWLLDPERGTTPHQQGPLADSLRYAGRLKILPPPPKVGGSS